MQIYNIVTELLLVFDTEQWRTQAKKAASIISLSVLESAFNVTLGAITEIRSTSKFILSVVKILGVKTSKQTLESRLDLRKCQ